MFRLLRRANAAASDDAARCVPVRKTMSSTIALHYAVYCAHEKSLQFVRFCTYHRHRHRRVAAALELLAGDIGGGLNAARERLWFSIGICAAAGGALQCAGFFVDESVVEVCTTCTVQAALDHLGERAGHLETSLPAPNKLHVV